MTDYVQLNSDTSGGNWTDYPGPKLFLSSRNDLTTFTENGHHEVFRFRAPAKWRNERQRAVLIGHICFRTPNFSGRRPWNVRAIGGLSVAQAGVCGCSHEMRPGSTFPGGAQRDLAMDFMIDVRFTSDADTVVQVRMDYCGSYLLKNFDDTQTTLWVVPVDERSA